MKKEKRTVKVTEKKLADGIIKLDCEATAIEVNNALKEAAEVYSGPLEAATSGASWQV